MQKRAVRDIAQRGGVGLEGIKVRIIRQADLRGKGLFGITASAREIHLYLDTLEAATKPGGKAQVIDTTRLRCLVACPDSPPGHVSIRPRNPLDLPGWLAARGSGRTHPLTQELMDAIVGVERRPK